MELHSTYGWVPRRNRGETLGGLGAYRQRPQVVSLGAGLSQPWVAQEPARTKQRFRWWKKIELICIFTSRSEMGPASLLLVGLEALHSCR